MNRRWACRTAVIVVWALALTPADGFSQNFEPTHIHKSASVSFDATPEAVFAVLVPAGQQSLSRNWEIDILWPLTGQVPPGAVFTKTHRHAEVQQVWTVAEVDAPRPALLFHLRGRTRDMDLRDGSPDGWPRRHPCGCEAHDHVPVSRGESRCPGVCRHVRPLFRGLGHLDSARP